MTGLGFCFLPNFSVCLAYKNNSPSAKVKKCYPLGSRTNQIHSFSSLLFNGVPGVLNSTIRQDKNRNYTDREGRIITIFIHRSFDCYKENPKESIATKTTRTNRWIQQTFKTQG